MVARAHHNEHRLELMGGKSLSPYGAIRPR